MCGICGIYQYKSGDPADKQVLRHMLGVIRHREPDDEGVYVDKNLALGIRRLSIIDLVGGKQPIYNEDRSVVVVYNGEIYNYRELREQLQRRGHVFATSSDMGYVEKLLNEHEAGFADHGILLWGLLNVELWYRVFVDQPVQRDWAGKVPLLSSREN